MLLETYFKCSFSTFLGKTVCMVYQSVESLLKLLVTSVSLQQPRFALRSDQWAMWGQVLLRALWLSHQYHSTVAPYSFMYHLEGGQRAVSSHIYTETSYHPTTTISNKSKPKFGIKTTVYHHVPLPFFILISASLKVYWQSKYKIVNFSQSINQNIFQQSSLLITWVKIWTM
jgi:hypothetical protein